MIYIFGFIEILVISLPFIVHFTNQGIRILRYERLYISIPLLHLALEVWI